MHCAYIHEYESSKFWLDIFPLHLASILIEFRVEKVFKFWWFEYKLGAF